MLEPACETDFKANQATLCKVMLEHPGVICYHVDYPSELSLCDFFLSLVPVAGERYLLFLGRRDGELKANDCFMPGPVAEKGAESEEL